MNEETTPWLGKLSDLRRAIQKREQAEARPRRAPSNLYPEPKIVGSTIKWKPIDRTAAMVTAPATGLNRPDVYVSKAEALSLKQPKKKKKTRKKKTMEQISIEGPEEFRPSKNNWVSTSGVRITMVNGEPMLNVDDIHTFLCAEVAKLPKEIRPNVRAAEDARKIIGELVEGIGAEMEKFRADTKRYLEDIRGSRFAVVTETAQMTNSLKEVRQFFLGGDYKEEIGRLREFVELCERLEKLKASGFLDLVADTMLRLAV